MRAAPLSRRLIFHMSDIVEDNPFSERFRQLTSAVKPVQKRLIQGGVKVAVADGINAIQIHTSAQKAGAGDATIYREFTKIAKFRTAVHDFVWTEFGRALAATSALLDDGTPSGYEHLTNVIATMLGNIDLRAADEERDTDWRSLYKFILITLENRPLLYDTEKAPVSLGFVEDYVASLARRAVEDGSAPAHLTADRLTAEIWMAFRSAASHWTLQSTERGVDVAEPAAIAVRADFVRLTSADPARPAGAQGSTAPAQQR